MYQRWAQWELLNLLLVFENRRNTFKISKTSLKILFLKMSHNKILMAYAEGKYSNENLQIGAEI